MTWAVTWHGKALVRLGVTRLDPTGNLLSFYSGVFVYNLIYTPFPLTRLPLTGLLVNRTDGVPVIQTVPLTGVRLMGTEYTKFVNWTMGSPVNRSPVNGSPVNKFRREVPLTRLSG